MLSIHNKNKLFLVTLLVLALVGLYLGTRFYIFLKPSSELFPLNLKWEVDLGIFTYERPAYQDGVVLFPANGVITSTWYGLETTTGQVVWSQAIGRNNYLRCLTQDYLVVSGRESLMVLDPSNGKIVWPGEVGISATCSDTAVFTVVPRQFVEALDISTGQYLWRGINPHHNVSGVIYNSEENELIAGGLIVIDPVSGKVLRSFEPSPHIHTPTDQGRGPMDLINQGELFIGGSVRDAKTGEVLHEGRFAGFAAPTITDGTIYIADAGGHPYPSGVVALDRETYEVKWKYQPQHKLPMLQLVTLSPVAIFDGFGYAIFSDATLRVFDLETGQELGYWQPKGFNLMLWPGCFLPIPQLPNPFDCIHSSGVGMAASEEALFVSFGDGKLYAFDKGE